MKLKNFLVESGYWLGMIAALWFAVHSCAAHAQTSRYWMACAVIHEHGRQCFTPMKPVSVNVDWLAIGNDCWMPLNVETDTIYASVQFGWITDSIKWVATDTTFEGNCKCEHDWLIGSVYPLAIRSVDMIYMKSNFVLVCASGYHPKNSMRIIGSKYKSHEPEEHCPFEVMEREKICRKCLFSVIESEKWFQRFFAPPKSEFEILKEKQRAKQ